MTWERMPIGDLLQRLPNNKVVQQGWSPLCETHPAATGNWGVLKTTAIQAGQFAPQHNKALPEGLEPRATIEVEVGDLLLTCAGPRARCGVPALVRATPGRLMMSGKMYRLRPDGRLDARFLELFLLSDEAQERIDEMKTGISDSGLNLTHGRFIQLQVPVPPMEEQLRVVAILEDHLSHLDAAEKSLRTVQRRLVALERAALNLHFGVTGKTVALAEFVQDISAGKSFGSSNSPASADEWGIIKVSAMTWGEFRPNENKAVPADRIDLRFEIKAGDLLVSRANTADYVGASVLVGEIRPRLLLSDKSLRVSPRAGVDPRWLWRVLQAPSARAQITQLATGTKDSMRNISQASLKMIQVPHRDESAQLTSVAAFDRVSESIAIVTSEIALQLVRSKSLRKSLLAAAFAGRLTGSSHDLSWVAETMTA